MSHPTVILGLPLALARLIALFALTLYSILIQVGIVLIHGNSRRRAASGGTAWARRVLRLCGIQVELLGELPGEPALVVPNHRSYIDIPVIMSLIPCAFLAKVEVSRWPVLGRAARLGNTIFVTREDRGSRKAARESVRAMVEKGFHTVVFAEGTTSRAPGMLPFRRGIFETAAQAAIPVIPVALEYAEPDDAWVGDDTFIRHFLACFGRPRIRVSLRFGPVLCATSGEELCQSAQSWITGNLPPVSSLQPRGSITEAA